MIFDLLLLPITAIVHGALYLLPDAGPLSSSFTTMFALIGNAISYAGIVFPADAIKTCGLLLLYAYSSYIAMILYTWITNFVPWLKPFSRQHITTTNEFVNFGGQTYHNVRTRTTMRR